MIKSYEMQFIEEYGTAPAPKKCKMMFNVRYYSEIHFLANLIE